MDEKSLGTRSDREHRFDLNTRRKQPTSDNNADQQSLGYERP